MLRALGRALAVLLAFGALVLFAALLSRATLQPSQAAESLTHTNLRPGASIRDYLEQPEVFAVVQQLGGNILLGAPFGVLLPVMAPQLRGFLKVTLCTAVVMLLVETVQGVWVTGRAFDVDDVLLNATGALLGYVLVGRRLSRAVHVQRHSTAA
ncbi:VanZ family protein [Streptomyces sp. NPDC006990]|uniref:VanZ family protein n=1 Tax=unclassified Streptomyces TaxID=2593676 RepID=UPI003457209E